jgi:MFS family permease
LAWALFAIVTVVALFNLVDVLTNRPVDDNLITIVGDLSWGTFPIVFAFLAALIVSYRPRNVIGWLMIAPALTSALITLSNSYLEQFPIPPASPTALLYLALVIENIGWLFLIFPLLFTMLLFPNGRPLSPRWRWALWAGLGMILFLILFGLSSPTFSRLDNEDWIISNPIGFLPSGTEFPYLPWFAALMILTLICAAAPFVRYRRAAGVEREQIKWLFYASGLFALFFVPGFFFPDSEEIFNAFNALLGIGLMAIPVAIAIAILRYRLYDINVIIRRTLVYGALTVLLLLVYFGSILLLQTIFTAVSGQQSAVAIVISTLVIAALFNPLRRRVQDFIDRRFFRRKYDAAQTLEQFAVTARDEVDLDNLTAELVQVVEETMQPEKVTLWLKKS